MSDHVFDALVKESFSIERSYRSCPDDAIVVLLVQASTDLLRLLPGLAGNPNFRLTRPIVLNQWRTCHASNYVVRASIFRNDVLSHLVVPVIDRKNKGNPMNNQPEFLILEE